MNRPSLQALALFGLSALFLGAAGCSSMRPTPGAAWSAPQTGTHIGRQVRRQAAAPSARRAPAAKAERQQARRAGRSREVDEDYVTRGGFR